MSNTATATLARAARRGVTLIEAILFISIALGLIVGGIVFYNQANTASTTNDAARNINAMASEIRSLYNDRAAFTGLDAQTLIRAGAIPANLVNANGTTINNEFAGGSYTVGVDPANANQFFIQSNAIPDQVCSRLGVFTGTQGVVGIGIAQMNMYSDATTVLAGDNGANFTGAPDNAATKCEAADNLRITFTR